MRLLLAYALFAAAACNGDMSSMEGDPPTGVGAVVVADCGEAPVAPGWSVSFDNDTAKLSADQFHAIEAWRDQVAGWQDCVIGHD